MKNRLRNAVLLTAATALGGPASVSAEDFSFTDLQLLYTTRSSADAVNGTGTSDEKMRTVRFEHYGTFSLGDNYFSLDFFNGNDVGGAGAGSFGQSSKMQHFFVYMPRLSLSRISGKSFAFGPIKDVGLMARFENASYGNYRASAAGISLNWNVPGTAYFETALYYRDTNFSDPHPLLRTVWISPFQVGGMKMNFDGLLLVSRPDGLGTNILAQPELRVALDAKGSLEAGIRVEHARYSTAAGRYSRTTPNLMLRWNY